MQMTTTTFFSNPCDEEEDNLATLHCFIEGDNEDFILTRYPDEDEVVIIFEDEEYARKNVVVTFSPQSLLIKIDDIDVFNEQNFLEIAHNTAPEEWAQIEETLRNILKDTGNYISSLPK